MQLKLWSGTTFVNPGNPRPARLTGGLTPSKILPARPAGVINNGTCPPKKRRGGTQCVLSRFFGEHSALLAGKCPYVLPLDFAVNGRFRNNCLLFQQNASMSKGPPWYLSRPYGDKRFRNVPIVPIFRKSSSFAGPAMGTKFVKVGELFPYFGLNTQRVPDGNLLQKTR